MASAETTLTAPSTPIAVCGWTGVKVRGQIVPPSRGAATSVVLGTDALVTSPRPISFPAWIRSAWIRSSSAWSAARSWYGSYPGTAPAGGPAPGHDHRHAVVDGGDLHPVDLVPQVPGGQQGPGGRTFGIGEVEHDR